LVMEPTDTIEELRRQLEQARKDAVAREAELQRYHQQLEAANARLQELATTDPLTGVANRRVFDQRMSIDFAHARRYGRALAVMILDVDNFKQRNDRYGHDEGDATLKRFAALLARGVREADLVVRYGGEEFVLLLPETNEQQALMMSNRILAMVRGHEWGQEQVTVSGGIADLQPSIMRPHELVTRADRALYAAKRAGKDRFVGWTEVVQAQK
jgi:diguanylate cyclase (GGDEF)-like protein